MGCDVRGLYYNPHTDGIETVTFDPNNLFVPHIDVGPRGLLRLGRDANGLLTGSNVELLASLPGHPSTDPQLIPAYDPTRNCLYVAFRNPDFSGMVNVVDRSTGSLMRQFSLQGPAGPTSPSVVLYDAEREVLVEVSNPDVRVYDLTGAYLGSSRIPDVPIIDFHYGLAYTNGQLFVTNSRNNVTDSWHGYTIFGVVPEPAVAWLALLGPAFWAGLVAGARLTSEHRCFATCLIVPPLRPHYGG